MIGIIGAGSFGTALGAVLARNTKEPVYIFGQNVKQLEEINSNNTNEQYLPGIKLPANLKAKFELEDIVSSVNDILIVIPSAGFADFVKSLKPTLKQGQRVAWATKGLDAKNHLFLHEVMDNTFGSDFPYAVISGPSFAREVASEIPTAVAIASNSEDFSKELIDRFFSKNFRVYNNNDIVGVQLGGIVKNIFAVACGISDGLGLGANTRAAIITRGMAEMLRLGKALGAKQNTLMGLAGLGDIILTCTDDQSRNRRLGLALGKGNSVESAKNEIGQAVEALDNCSAVCRIGKERNLELPIAETVEAILEGKMSPKDGLLELVSRKPTSEFD